MLSELPTFTIELLPDLPMLSTQRLPLFQVFANLIGNGIKHHDRPDGSIQDRRECYEFAIADDGLGIAPEQWDRTGNCQESYRSRRYYYLAGVGTR